MRQNIVSALLVGAVVAAGLVASALAPPALTAYTGPSVISSCQTIDHKDIPFGLDIRATNGDRAVTNDEASAKAQACVVITSSVVHGIIDTRWTGAHTPTYGPLFIADSEVRGDGSDNAALTETNLHVWRTYVHGNRSGVQCDGFCEVHDSQLVADTEVGAAHMDAFITNGNYGAPILLDHNTFLCAPSGPVPNGAGCAADVGLFGDFSAITNVTLTNNTFKATADAYYCLHGPYESGKPYPDGGGDKILNNVFERGSSGHCGGANAVFQWAPVAGQWCHNVYDDGTSVLASPDNCLGGLPSTSTSSTVTVAPSTSTTSPVATTVPPSSTTTTVPPACLVTPRGDRVCVVQG